MSAPLITIKNSRAGIGPLRKELTEEYWKWEIDPHFLVAFGRRLPQSKEAHAASFETASRAAWPRVAFTIYDLDGGEPTPIGVTSLCLDEPMRNAEYTLMIAPEGRGRGLATEATSLVLDYAFDVMHLAMVNLKVIEHNAPAIRAYENAGFRHAGLLRQNAFWYGKRVGEVIMDVAPEERTRPSVITRP